jgi:hypothetical protein
LPPPVPRGSSPLVGASCVVPAHALSAASGDRTAPQRPQRRRHTQIGVAERGQHRLDEGLTVVVAAPDDILRSEAAAGREKDRAELRKCAMTSSSPRRSEPQPRPGADGLDSSAEPVGVGARVGTRWEQIASRRDLARPLMSSLEIGRLQVNQEGKGSAVGVARLPTEPKVRGSNPLGRAFFQRFRAF